MKSVTLTNQHIKTAMRLFAVAAICLLLIFSLFNLTQQAAKDSEKHFLIQSLSKVLPRHDFDNDLLSTRSIDSKTKTTIYQACQRGQPRYQIYEIETYKGYSGLIRLLVAVDLQSRHIVQARPLFHQETPGLGDQIEVEKSPWLRQFYLPLTTPRAHIAIKKDGGQIDSITGATITSRAVTYLMRKTFFERGLTNLTNLCNNKTP
ncbi:MAG: hypothetical protein CSA47_00915 [Gammaproteobacteria bacterium]|nr:MAG: hypothetical protein CSA47_00915 [Gammaproteobacteria bacterium]